VLPNPLPVPGLQPVLGSTAPNIRGTSELAAQKTLRDSERELIIQTLDVVGWVVGGLTGAAAKLGLPRSTLTHKMKKLGIERLKRIADDRRLERTRGLPESRAGAVFN
jgi:DNA-binding NtrC family response regulator